MGLFTRDIQSFDDLYEHQLRNIYYAENLAVSWCRSISRTTPLSRT